MSFDPNARIDPSHVEDRRGRGGAVLAGGGGIGLIVVLVASLLLGVNPLDVIDPAMLEQQPNAAVESEQKAAECRTGADANVRDDCRIVAFVDSIQGYWSGEFGRRGWSWSAAKTVLFTGSVQAECGTASTAVGPFYCPLDEKVYLDLAFFQDLRRLGARGGPFAEAYVVAHEYGHHVQKRLGLLTQARGSGPESTSVRQELTADCLAGVWARHASSTGIVRPLTEADIAAALDAAAAVGDDRIQQQTQGRVSPEAWTHGSSADRQRAFSDGLRRGDTADCGVR